MTDIDDLRNRVQEYIAVTIYPGSANELIRDLLHAVQEREVTWRKISDQFSQQLRQREDTIERLKQALSQVGDNIELQEAEQRGYLRGSSSFEPVTVEQLAKAIGNGGPWAAQDAIKELGLLYRQRKP
jgi:chromosome segregation and condensation protein ScpB